MRDIVEHADLRHLPLTNSQRYSSNTQTTGPTNSLRPHEQFLMKKSSASASFVPGDLVFAAFSNYSWPAIVTQIGEKTLEIVTLILEQDEIIEKDRAALFEGNAQLEKIVSVLTPGERMDFEEASQSLIELNSISKQDRLKYLRNGTTDTLSDNDCSTSDHESSKENVTEIRHEVSSDIHVINAYDNGHHTENEMPYAPTNATNGEAQKLNCVVNDMTFSPVKNHLDKILQDDICNTSQSSEFDSLVKREIDRSANHRDESKDKTEYSPKKKLSRSELRKQDWAKKKTTVLEKKSCSQENGDSYVITENDTYIISNDGNLNTSNDGFNKLKLKKVVSTSKERLSSEPKNSRKRKRDMSKEELDDIKITAIALARAKKLQELLNSGNTNKYDEVNDTSIENTEEEQAASIKIPFEKPNEPILISLDMPEKNITEISSVPIEAKKGITSRTFSQEEREVRHKNLAEERAARIEKRASKVLLESCIIEENILKTQKSKRTAAQKLLESQKVEEKTLTEKRKRKPLSSEAIDNRRQNLVKARAARVNKLASKKVKEYSIIEDEKPSNNQPPILILLGQSSSMPNESGQNINSVTSVTSPTNELRTKRGRKSTKKSEPIINNLSTEELNTTDVLPPTDQKTGILSQDVLVSNNKPSTEDLVKMESTESVRNVHDDQEPEEASETTIETSIKHVAVAIEHTAVASEQLENNKSEQNSTDESATLNIRNMVEYLAPYYFNLFTDQIKEQIENQIKIDIKGLTEEEKDVISRVLNKSDIRGVGKIKKQAYEIISKLVKNSPCQKLLKNGNKTSETLPDVGPGTPPASPKAETRASNNIRPCLNKSRGNMSQGIVHNPFPINLVQITENNKNDYLESKMLPKHTIIPKSWSNYMGKKYNLSSSKTVKSPYKKSSYSKKPSIDTEIKCEPHKSSKRKKTESPAKAVKESKSNQTLKVKKLAVLFRIKDIQKTITNPLELNVDGVKWDELEKKTRNQYLELSKRVSALPPDERSIECLALDLFVKNNKDSTRLDWDSLKQNKKRKFLTDAKKLLSKNKQKEKDQEKVSDHNEELIMELINMGSRKRKRESNVAGGVEPSSKKEKSDGTLLDYLCINCFTIEYNPKLFTTCTSCHGMFHKSCVTEVTQKKDPKPKYMCTDCQVGEICALCRKPDNLKSCLHCPFKYHECCVRPHMSSQIISETSFICPYHVCGSCEARPEVSIRNFVRCVRCPQSFHENHIPAGCMRLSKSHILCYRHYKGFGSIKMPIQEGNKSKRKRKSGILKTLKKKTKQQHVNVPFCFQCTFGGELICCEGCPASFHKDCMPEDHLYTDNDSSWLCPDCIVGKKPWIGDIIWVKFGAYRWWPCQILDELDLPDNIFNKIHLPCQFPVICLGTKEFAWVDMERVYSYEDGDKGSLSNTGGGITNSFKLSIVEAKELHAQVKPMKEATLKETSMSDRPSSKKPAPFRFIKTNVPYNSAMRDYEKQLKLERMPFPCDCTAADKCSADSSCINRVLLTECPPSCKWDKECQNQRFQRRQYPETKLLKTEGRGWGMITCEDISPGTLVHEYVGEIIDEGEVERRLNEYQSSGITDYYMLTVENSRIIDAKPKANNARFMNHSCDPNCETQKWNVCGLTCIGLFAKREIKSGDELTFDYQFDTRGQVKTQCLCGSSNCSGYLGLPAKKILEPAKEPKKKLKKKKRKKVNKVTNEVVNKVTNEAVCNATGKTKKTKEKSSDDANIQSESSETVTSETPSSGKSASESSSGKTRGRPKNSKNRVKGRLNPQSKSALKKAILGRKTSPRNVINIDNEEVGGIEDDLLKIEAIVNSTE